MADRGIMTGGIYRWVRHPPYTAYLVAFCGCMLNHPSLYNIGVYACMILLLVLRLVAEERLLVKNTEYQEYTQKVRWRLLPFVF